MKKILRIVITALILLQTHNLTTYYYQTLSGTTQYQPLVFNLTSGYNFIAIQFQVTNRPFSNLLAFASLSPIISNLTLQDISKYFATGSNNLNFMDPIAVIGGNPQIINLNIQNQSNDILYIGLYNFDYPEIKSDKAYSITFHYLTTGIFCSPCPNGASLYNNISHPLQCQCSPCQTNYRGAACQYYLEPLVEGRSINKDIMGYQKLFFTIPHKGSSMVLRLQELSNKNSVKLYIQYEFSSGELAGKINCRFDDFSLPFQILVTLTPASVYIPTRGRNVLLTFHNTGPVITSMALNFIYSSSKQSNIFMIVLVSCLGSLAVVIAFAIIFKTYRYLKMKSITVANESSIFFRKSKIQGSQMDIFSPEITAQSFYSMKKKQSQKCSNEQPQCSICFDTIKKSQRLRITYCKHIFHSDCLKGWFQTTHKCPDCNQIFDVAISNELRNKPSQNNNFSKTLIKSFWQSQQFKKGKIIKPKNIQIQEQKSMQQIKVEDLQQNQDDITQS